MKNSCRICPALTPEKKSANERYQQELTQSVNYIGKIYVEREIAHYRSQIATSLDDVRLLALERVKDDMHNGRISGGEAHKMVNRIIYEQ